MPAHSPGWATRPGNDRVVSETGISTPRARTTRGKRGAWRPLVLVGVVVAVIVLAGFLDVGARFEALREWIDSLGSWGPAAFVLIYVLAVVFAFPASALTVVAGALFGTFWGVVLVSIGSTAGAGLSFLIARYFAREATARWLSRSERFTKLDALAGEHGAVIVALTRLVPIFPFNLLNYGFGLTRVPFTTYLFWSWLCMLPGTLLYVLGGDAVTRGLAEGRVPWGLVLALAAVALSLLLVVRLARRRLQNKSADRAARGVDATGA